MEKVQRVFPVEKFNVGALMLYGVFLPGEGLLNRLWQGFAQMLNFSIIFFLRKESADDRGFSFQSFYF